MQPHPSLPRVPKRQLDLFAGGPPPTPAWSTLPDQVRRTLASMMTRLLLAHARDAGARPRSDRDEH
ncbi:MAG: hypothetical protein ACR2RF_02240 [Geminicoccaceae bacterium]